MPLDATSFYNGLFSFIYVIISLYVGIRISSIYFKYKERDFILVGVTWIGITSPYLASSTSFVIALITGGEGFLNYPTIYFFIAVGFIPIIIVMWFTAITDFLYKEKQKPILIVVSIVAIILEIITLLMLFTDSRNIGELEGPVDTSWSLFMIVYYLALIVTMFITGLLFARRSIASKDPEVNLKGKLIMLAFILWLFGAILDSVIDYPITRLIMCFSAVLFYFGFILPKWLKKKI